MDFIDSIISKQEIPGKGYGFFATETIPASTIIIKETPGIMIKRKVISSELFELLFIVLNDDKLLKQFMKLCPESLKDYRINEKSILKELKSIKSSNLVIYKFITENFDMNDILLYCAKYMCNAFDFKGKPVILFTGTLLNHSCLPNVIFGQKDNQMHFITTRKIMKGEEINDSYIDITSSREQRYKELKDQYGFICKCTRCTCKENDINKYENEALKIEAKKKHMFGYSKSNKV